MAASWDTALLHALGMPATKANRRFLQSWQRFEGGATNNNASYNWLNTTQGRGPSINSVGVKAFPDFATGIHQLAATIRNGRYQDILGALASGNPYAHPPVAGLETWVSGSPTGNPAYAAKVLGSSAPISNSVASAPYPGGYRSAASPVEPVAAVPAHSQLALALIDYARSGGSSIGGILRALASGPPARLPLGGRR